MPDQVWLVGLDRRPLARRLRERLTADGVTVRETDNPAALVLDESGHATVVVYSPDRGETARRVLEGLREARRATPVVVVVNRADFAEYYDLMSRGALEYFEIDEPPELIASGVEWALRKRAG